MRTELNNERIYAYSPSANVVCRVLIPQRFTREQYEVAMRDLIKALPHLNSVFDIDDQRNPYLREVAFMMPEIIYMNRINSKFYRKVVQEEERIPFVRRNNPLYRIVVLEDEEKSELLWISHRLLLDEESTKRVCSAFVSHLQGEELPEFSFVSGHEVSESLNYYWSFKKKRLLHYFEKHQHEFKEIRYREMFMDYYSKHRTKIEEISFTQEDTKDLLMYCKEANVSLDALINVCFACAQEKHENKNNKAFHTIVWGDTSKSIEETELGYFKDIAKLEFTYANRKSLKDNVIRFENLVSKLKQSSEIHESSFIHNLPVDLLGDMFALGDSNQEDYAVSSLKKAIYDVKHRHGMAYLPLQATTCKGCELFQVLPSLFLNDEKMVCSVICNDCLNITMQYNRMNTNSKDMREIMNCVVAMLSNCCKGD